MHVDRGERENPHRVAQDKFHSLRWCFVNHSGVTDRDSRRCEGLGENFVHGFTHFAISMGNALSLPASLGIVLDQQGTDVTKRRGAAAAPSASALVGRVAIVGSALLARVTLLTMDSGLPAPVSRAHVRLLFCFSSASEVLDPRTTIKPTIAHGIWRHVRVV